MRLAAVIVLGACAAKADEVAVPAPAVPVVAPASTTSASSPASMPLTAADIAPCVFLDKPFANSYTTPSDKPRAESFQGVSCNGSETDVQILDFGDAAEAARQAELLRAHLGLEIARASPSYSPFAMLTYGGRLALLASPAASRLVYILVRRGYVDISHARHP